MRVGSTQYLLILAIVPLLVYFFALIKLGLFLTLLLFLFLVLLSLFDDPHHDAGYNVESVQSQSSEVHAQDDETHRLRDLWVVYSLCDVDRN